MLAHYRLPPGHTHTHRNPPESSMLSAQRGPGVTLQFHRDLSSSFQTLYQEKRLTDMKIVIDDADSTPKEFQVHRLILAAQSPFFEAMFFNPCMIESTAKVVQLKEIDADVFEILLKIVYCGYLDDIAQQTPEKLVRLYMLMERYQFKFEHSLLREIADKVFSAANFWSFLDLAVSYNTQSFIELCFEYFNLLSNCDKRGGNHSPLLKRQDKATLFAHDDFFKISHDTLKVLLDRNHNCPEALLLRSTQNWINCNGNSLTNSEKCLLVKRIRLNLIPEFELLNCVQLSDINYSDIQEAHELIQNGYQNIIDFYLLTHYGCTKQQSFEYHDFVKKAQNEIVKNRSFLISNYNVCQADFGFQMNYRPHLLADPHPGEIFIKLGFPFKLNYIELIMSDLKGDKYSYILEYSVDGINWIILYDYRKYLCSNHQTLFFNPIVSSYFRLKGFHQNRLDTRSRRSFKAIKSFNAFFKDLNASVDVRLTDGVLNTSFFSCQIKHRVYCDTTVTLSADERYYCQKMTKESLNQSRYDSLVLNGFKPVYVLFDQPIVLSSFAFRLFDREQSAYSYLLEIWDQNKFTWENVTERTKESGWQNMFFSARPVNWIRIICTGSFNSDQEFRILKFNFNPNVLNA